MLDVPGAGYNVAAGMEPAYGTPTRETRRWTPVTALRFVGCESCRMTLREYEDYPEDGRKIEFFDSEAGLAWMLRDGPRREHEEPARRLTALVERISLTRGSPVRCLGESQVRLLDPDSRQVRLIHPDEMVFLQPERAGDARRGFLRVGEDAYPDVVLEVDHTTDIRRSKLALYEEWGFPELWVEVPDAYSAGRPRGLRPELRIYRLAGERYVLSHESRAFPGWQGSEIHRALNEPVVSAETSAVLARVGRALGEREGTGPDDDPLLCEQRAAARREGRAEGVAEGIARMVDAMLRERGISVPANVPAGVAGRYRDVLRRASEEQLLGAVAAADSFADFLSRLEGPAL